MLIYPKILYFGYKIFGTYYYFLYYCIDNISILTLKFIYMENLTALLQFVQQEHRNIKSVSFQHSIFPDQVSCYITLKGNLYNSTDTRKSENTELVALIDLFIGRFGAKLHHDFCPDNIELYVISELNK